MYSYSSRNSRRGRNGRRKKKSALYTNFHCDPDPWQGSPPQTPPSSDDESAAPVSVARNSSLRSGAAVAKAVAIAPSLSTKNRGRRINSVKRKISKYVNRQNANVLQNRQPARPQCTAPVPLPLFVKKKIKSKSKQTAPVPMPHHITHSKSKSKSKKKVKMVPRMSRHIAQMSTAKKNKRALVTANAPRNPNQMPITTPTDIPTPQHFDDEAADVDAKSEMIDFGLIPDAYFIGYGNEALLTAESGDRNAPNGSRESETGRTMDMMDVNIAEIQNLQDLDEPQRMEQTMKKQTLATKPKEHLSPQSNGSLSGAEIVANHIGQLSDSANGQLFLQDSYNVLSDLTDFSISDGSHKNIEMEIEREIEMELEMEPLEGNLMMAMASVSKMDLLEMDVKTIGIDEGDENEHYFGDDKFNMLAQEIMFESMELPTQQRTLESGHSSKQQQQQPQQPPSFQMPPYQPYSKYTADASSQDYSYRYQCPVSTNIWAEPKRAQSANTLAGLLMNGLEPISTKMFTL